MAFKVFLIPSAEQDLEAGMEYYNSISAALAQKFYSDFLDLNMQLEQNPYFEKRYKNIRTLKLRSFPYIIHFVVNETLSHVTIIAVVFGKQEKNNFEQRLI